MKSAEKDARGKTAGMASNGGKARSASLSAARRSEIARMGGEARRRSLCARDRRKIAKTAVATRWEARRNARRIEDNFLKIPIFNALRSLNV